MMFGAELKARGRPTAQVLYKTNINNKIDDEGREGGRGEVEFREEHRRCKERHTINTIVESPVEVTSVASINVANKGMEVFLMDHGLVGLHAFLDVLFLGSL